MTTLRRRMQDKVPRLFSLTPPKFEDFQRRTNAQSPADYVDCEVRSVHLLPTEQQTDFSPYLGPLPPNAWVNEWGIGNVPGGFYHFEDPVHPLRCASSAADDASYPFPDVTADYRYARMSDQVADWHRRGYAVAAGIPISAAPCSSAPGFCTISRKDTHLCREQSPDSERTRDPRFYIL